MSEGLPECIADYGHEWRTLGADVKGYGSLGTHVQERCHNCGIIRLNPNRKVFVPDHKGGYKEAENGD